MVKRICIILLLIFIISPIAQADNSIDLKNLSTLENSSGNKNLPYYEEINKILGSLEYSAFHIITKPEIALSIDFNKRKWTLHSIHQYDAKGEILLDQGRYGLCAELSTYLYEKIKPILSSQYDVKFAMVTEEGFFLKEESNHIVLLMRDKLTPKIYLMDPSFQKYGNLQDFTDYKIINVQDALSFVQDKSHDISFQADQAIPLFIKDDLLVSFSVSSVDGEFDKNNFLLIVSANRRNKRTDHNIVMVGKYNNRLESFESRELLDKLLKPEDIAVLHKKLDAWMTKI
ncbi:MAG: hypothetical protein WCH62_02890 [Candidatus Omnitrophota bacterium]